MANKDNNKEIDIEMLARMMAKGFAEIKEQMTDMNTGLQGQINSMQTQLTVVHEDLQYQIDALQSEMRTGFEGNRAEHREINKHLESLDRKQIGALESLDETVLKSEFDELADRVVVLETKMA
ncbi:MAG: hypothetical protein WCT49_05825 [Candidatus Paceibacterota bacterium]|jgi:DNA anti-recombination protein RmuC|nr:hypothetical protein [Candidatus Paceibacterota bacterium]